MEQAEDNVKPKKQKRELNFDKYPQRRIALSFLYFGWEFSGLVMQPNQENSVESIILGTMERLTLIRSKEHASWSRSGRTDVGVSGFRQVASCIVRSTDVNGKFVYWPEDSQSDDRITKTEELDYVKILNANLPQGIRILAWAPVSSDFNARFNCTERVYSYIFPKTNLDLEKIRSACSFLVGMHDFRNFCQIDKSDRRVHATYLREIFLAEINELTSGEQPPAYNLCQLVVKGSGFLWHQIRFIVSLLYDIGCGNENPEIILELLDIEKTPSRPQYGMAKGLPLCFFDCSYENNLEWVCDSKNLCKVFTDLERAWVDMRIKAERLKSMLNEIAEVLMSTDLHTVQTKGLDAYIRDRHVTGPHVPIMNRRRCDSLAELKAKFEEKHPGKEHASDGGDASI